jgi:hypothetical protein
LHKRQVFVCVENENAAVVICMPIKLIYSLIYTFCSFNASHKSQREHSKYTIDTMKLHKKLIGTENILILLHNKGAGSLHHGATNY